MALLGLRFVVRPPDVLHLQWLPLLGWSPIDKWFVTVARARGIPIVHTVHNVLPHDTSSDRVRRAYAWLYRSATVLICHTQEAANQLVDKFGIARSQIEVIPHGPIFDIGGDGLAAGSIEERSDSDTTVVLSLGVIRPYKGLEFLLEAWKMAAIPDARLIIAGGGESGYVAKIADVVANLDLTRSVDLRLGYVDNAEHDALHRSADIVVLPYREISQSGALMTAMAYGCAIVASDVGGFSEVIDNGRNGVLVPYGDTRALAEALTNLLSDSGLRERLGSAALADTRVSLSWRSIAQSTMEVYMKALPRGGAR